MLKHSGYTNNGINQYYAFVESRDFGQAPSLSKISENFSIHIGDIESINAEIILSIVDKGYFDEIEERFSVCNKELKEHRDKRVQNINEYLGPSDYTGMVNLWCNIGDGDGVHFREILQQGNWYVVSLDFTGNEGFPVIVIETEEIIESNVELAFLNSITSIPEYTYNRLIEIFSLKHIQTLGLEDDDRTPNQNNPTPPPILRDAVSLPKDDELFFDEFGYRVKYYSPYFSNKNTETVFWSYYKNNELYLTL